MSVSHSLRAPRAYGALAAIQLALAAPVANAHDFWLQPRDFRIDAGVTTPFTLQVGHGPFRQRSPIPMRRIERLDVVSADGSRDIRSRLRLGGEQDDGDVAFGKDGTYVLVVQTDDQAQSHLPAIRFNDYVRAEGLTPALVLRERTQRTDTEGAENYRRVAKAIVQVGARSADDDAHVTKAIGLPLEIVPEKNPYALPHGGSLPVRVVYERRPLAGALVKLTDLGRDAEPFETRVTDAEGRVEFTLPDAGTWLVNVIWTKPKPPGGDTDFETVFSSLSFRLPQRSTSSLDAR
jgi:uncharacterized GH25 family protein